MTLFGQKQRRIEFPKQEINPMQEVSAINKRINFLVNKEQSVDKKTHDHKIKLDSETEFIRHETDSLKNEIKEIKNKLLSAQDNFNNAVKELNIHAKIEDLDHLRRMVQEYDPADFISYEEFQRIVEERIKELRL